MPTSVSRDLLHRLPKAELHVHLDGSLRPETMLELADRYGKRMPADDSEALRDFMHVRDARNLVEYLERFAITLSVMQTEEALERIAYELAEDAAAENTRYIEVRFSPILNTREGLSLVEVVDASLQGLRRAERDFAIRTAIIVCGIRNMDPQTSTELAELTVAFKGRGVVAFDLAGGEHDHPPKRHRAAFDLVAEHNMPITVHAGEAYGPRSIHQALHLCHANRIGHGTHLYEDPDLLRYVNDLRIPVEVCLTSNVQTRAAPSLEAHPLRQFFDLGLMLSLNTDNRLMSATTLTEEFWRAHLHQGFEWTELTELASMSFEAAFLPREEKRELLRVVDAEIAALNAEPRS